MSSIRSYAVIGQPVAHSLSPYIHEQFAMQLGVSLSYGLLEPGVAGFAATVRDFFASGGKGVNVTVPFKFEAVQLADHISHSAQEAGAVNTLKADEDGGVSACNTDGAGLLADLRKQHSLDIGGMQVLVFGAGGAAAGILGPLIGKRPKQITIVNRSADKASQLVKRFAARVQQAAVALCAQNLTAKCDQAYDLVINATSAGHSAASLSVPDGVWAAQTCAYDLSYGAAARSFLTQASQAGAGICVDGLGMLVEQAALSFAYWEGQMPETQPVLKQLRELV